MAGKACASPTGALVPNTEVRITFGGETTGGRVIRAKPETNTVVVRASLGGRPHQQHEIPADSCRNVHPPPDS